MSLHMIVVFCGLPGAGKSASLARKALQLLEANRKLFRKQKVKRYLYSNMKFTQHIHDKYPGQIKHWDDPQQLINMRDCDIIIDELSLYFDAQAWADTPPSVKRFMRLHRHYGVNIWAVCQDFETIDISVRRLTQHLYCVDKIFGTREPSPERPNIRFPFVFSIVREVKRTSYADPKEEYKYETLSFFPFGKKLMNTFDTTEDIVSDFIIPLRHVVKKCFTCNVEKVSHR